MLRRCLYAVFVAGLSVGLALLGAKPSAASTPGCTAGAFQGYCGTQVDQENPAMAWDVFRQAAKVGQPLIAYPNSDSDQAVDFVALHPGTSSVGGAKMFIYAPGGRISNLCISEPSQGAALVQRVGVAGVHREAGRRDERVRVGELGDRRRRVGERAQVPADRRSAAVANVRAGPRCRVDVRGLTSQHNGSAWQATASRALSCALTCGNFQQRLGVRRQGLHASGRWPWDRECRF